MKKLTAVIATLALVAGQASVASAATKDAPVVTKAVMTSCAVPAKSTLAKAPRVVNRCDSEDRKGAFGIGLTPLIFGGAIVAGVVAVAVVTTDNNSATSP